MTLLYCIVLIAIDISFNTSIALLYPDWFKMVNLALCRVPVFIAGCFLALYVKEKREQQWLPIFCIMIAFFLVVILEKYRKLLIIYGIWRYLYGILGFCITIVVSIVLYFMHGSRLSRMFSFFGKYTLELYLTHTQILTVLQEQMPNTSDVLINVIAAGSSIIAAIIVHEGLSLVIKKLPNESC